jgi:hypothetical protein
MNKALPYDIVLLPSDELANISIEASEKLSPLGSLFTLKTGQYYPHLSLYMLQLQQESIQAIINRLENIGANTSLIALEAKEYTTDWGYICAQYVATDDAEQLQHTVVEQCHSFRNGMKELDRKTMQKARGVTFDNLQQYGYKPIGELFEPHITLTRFDKPVDNIEESLPPIEEFNGYFDRIGLFEMGNDDNGTCVREIASFRLQNRGSGTL